MCAENFDTEQIAKLLGMEENEVQSVIALLSQQEGESVEQIAQRIIEDRGKALDS